ncbi:MAG: GNAT family N-acetyltransferase [Pseudomonadota bacterium]
MAEAGDRIEYTITYLAMDSRPAAPAPAPLNANLALVRAHEPPVGYFLYLYGTVGEAHEWTDWFDVSEAEQAAFVHDPQIALYTLLVDGWPGGFFVLDTRSTAKDGVCDLAYFGLMPQAVGRGLGHWFLSTAVHTAWDMPGVSRITVNTCTLDHAAALPLYQKVGFAPEHRQEASRVLVRARPG